MNPEIGSKRIIEKVTLPTCMTCGYPLKKEQMKCPICECDRVWLDRLYPSTPENLIAQQKLMNELNHYESNCPKCQNEQYFHLYGDLDLIQRLNSLQCSRCEAPLNPVLKKLPKHAYRFYCYVDEEEFDIYTDDIYTEDDQTSWPKCQYCESRLGWRSQRW